MTLVPIRPAHRLCSATLLAPYGADMALNPISPQWPHWTGARERNEPELFASDRRVGCPRRPQQDVDVETCWTCPYLRSLRTTSSRSTVVRCVDQWEWAELARACR